MLCIKQVDFFEELGRLERYVRGLEEVFLFIPKRINMLLQGILIRLIILYDS